MKKNFYPRDSILKTVKIPAKMHELITYQANKNGRPLTAEIYFAFEELYKIKIEEFKELAKKNPKYKNADPENFEMFI
jgi:hypothetical protein